MRRAAAVTSASSLDSSSAVSPASSWPRSVRSSRWSRARSSRSRAAAVVDDGLVFFEPPFNSTVLADVDPAAMSRSFPLDAAGSAAPALGDLTGDGVDDLLLGGHHGTVFFFDGAAKVSPRFGGPDDADEDAVDNFYFQTAFRVDVE